MRKGKIVSCDAGWMGKIRIAAPGQLWYNGDDWQVYHMNSQIHTFSYPNGEIQRVQVARFEDWEALVPLSPKSSDRALDCFSEIYRKFLVPAAPWVFGSLVLFRLPEGIQMPFSFHTGHYGTVADPLTAAAVALRRGIRIRGGQVHFRDDETEAFWKALQEKDCIRIVRGKLPITTVIPVGKEAGFLTASAPEAALKVNSFFFTMDPFDCATAYDHVGRPFGLLVKNGTVEQPPLFSREALLVYRDGSIRISRPELEQLTVRIGDETFVHGENARIYTRPRHALTPPGRGRRLVIAGREVIAVRDGGWVSVPGAGFVICTDEGAEIKPGDRVTYGGLEDVRFGIQVGNSILRDGIPTEKFESRFFNVRGINRIAYPPSLYPLDFHNARAARIAIGADREGKPMILWAEGAAKIGQQPGVDSCGATLADMGRICAEVGMYNGVNLDGGGSAQLLVDGTRSLRISDRAPDGSQTERPIPAGLMIE